MNQKLHQVKLLIEKTIYTKKLHYIRDVIPQTDKSESPHDYNNIRDYPEIKRQTGSLWATIITRNK